MNQKILIATRQEVVERHYHQRPEGTRCRKEEDNYTAFM